MDFEQLYAQTYAELEKMSWQCKTCLLGPRAHNINYAPKQNGEWTISPVCRYNTDGKIKNIFLEVLVVDTTNLKLERESAHVKELGMLGEQHNADIIALEKEHEKQLRAVRAVAEDQMQRADALARIVKGMMDHLLPLAKELSVVKPDVTWKHDDRRFPSYITGLIQRSLSGLKEQLAVAQKDRLSFLSSNPRPLPGTPPTLTLVKNTSVQPPPIPQQTSKGKA